MKSKQVLDVQQMQHLQELGLDTSNASMCWIKTPNGRDLTFNDEWMNLEESILDPVPAYTLQDVLDALPKEITYENKRCWASIDLEDGLIGYYYENYSLYYKWAYFEVVMKDESIIDAAYELLVWTIEQGYVETNKNE